MKIPGAYASFINGRSKMRKKVTVLILIVSVVLMMFSLPASAVGGSLDYRAYYCWSNNFYCFAGLPGDAEEVSASVFDGDKFGSDVSPVTLAESGAMINYYLLIDLSSKMNNNTTAIADFAKELVLSEKNISVSILGCGASVSVESEALTSATEIENVILSLDFSSEKTNVPQGVTDALGYLSHKSVTAGDIVELVLFTSGGGALFTIPEENAEDTAISTADTADAIKATPEVIVHSFCFGKWNEDIKNAVSKGTGLVRDSNSQSNVREFAGALSEYNASIHLMKFRMYNFPDNGNRFETYLKTRYKNVSEQVTLNNIGRVDKIRFEDWKLPVREAEEGNASADTTEITPEETTVPTEDTGTGESTEVSGQDATTAPTGDGEAERSEAATGDQTLETGESKSGSGESTSSASQTDISVISVPTVTDVSSEAAAPAENQGNGGPDLTTILIIAGAGLAFIAGVVIIGIVIARNTSKKKRTTVPPYVSAPSAGPVSAPANTPSHVPASGSGTIPTTAPVGSPAAAFSIRIRFVSTGFADTVVNVAEPCIIGSNSVCTLQLHHATVTLRNAQIFCKDGEVYIEDLNQVSNTAVCGVRITGPVALSSGDEICVGNVRFRVYFQ